MNRLHTNLSVPNQAGSNLVTPPLEAPPSVSPLRHSPRALSGVMALGSCGRIVHLSWCEKIVKKSFSNAAGYHKTTPVSTRGRHKNNLYYLLPGMGHGARKRFWRNMALGVLMGVLVSALMVWLFSFLNSW